MITVVGESLVDLVRTASASSPPSEHPGGSPANVAVGLARLGVPATLITQLGNDAYGRLLRGHLAASGVAVRSLAGPAFATSTATAVLDEHGAASYDFRITWDVQKPLKPATGTRCLHTGSLATALDPGARAVEELLTGLRAEHGVTVSLDPNVRPALLPSREEARARIEHHVALADIVKVSEEDLAWLCPGQDPADVAERWQRTGPALVVVTLGAAGSLATARGGTVRRPAPAVTVADTVGAGDAFTTGMLHWLDSAGLLGRAQDTLHALDADSTSRMLDAASLVAALTCSRPGADPPGLHELRAFRMSSATPG
ncbi:carbohydrate kinase [Streptomyces sp. ISL-96]|uniref:carbohydrate kinase family protein n=1 Tax=Streptomyces sp. ISL-96 TaxID=2819191 RepID=UPI001BE9738D|nr:carbohydrate kinase [Streptomyces sp. ISL-96]MBT2492599.1 carbohydrate kinase [Streptomyces sp. ISL-96]